MTFRSSPIPDFLRAFGDGRAESLEPFLHEDVAYRVDGFEPVIGRRAVLAFWRRMFTAHDAVRMSLERQVRDGGTWRRRVRSCVCEPGWRRSPRAFARD